MPFIQAVLETLPNGFYEDLPDEVNSSFGEYMQHLSTEKLSNLLELLHEFLLLRVAVHENPDDDDYVDTRKYRCVCFVFEIYYVFYTTTLFV